MSSMFKAIGSKSTPNKRKIEGKEKRKKEREEGRNRERKEEAGRKKIRTEGWKGLSILSDILIFNSVFLLDDIYCCL